MRKTYLWYTHHKPYCWSLFGQPFFCKGSSNSWWLPDKLMIGISKGKSISGQLARGSHLLTGISKDTSLRIPSLARQTYTCRKWDDVQISSECMTFLSLATSSHQVWFACEAWGWDTAADRCWSLNYRNLLRLESGALEGPEMVVPKQRPFYTCAMSHCNIEQMRNHKLTGWNSSITITCLSPGSSGWKILFIIILENDILRLFDTNPN